MKVRDQAVLINSITMDEIEKVARRNEPGFRTFKKLLKEKRLTNE
jgi:hypothetical protein